MVLAWHLMCCAPQIEQSVHSRYEQAKEREMTNSEPVEEQIICKSKTSTATCQEDYSDIRRESLKESNFYSVVIGSFKNKTNAYSLKERMQNEGYMPALGENEQGMLRSF